MSTSASSCLSLQPIKNFFSKGGANVAGVLWNAGNGVQFLMGAVTLTPHVIISSAVNVASSSSSMLFGHKDWGVSLAGILGMIGTALFLYPQILAGSTSVLIGYLIYCTAASFGAWGAPLSQRFSQAKASLPREIFGRPRRTMGTILFVSRLPVIATAFTQQDWTTLLPFLVWAAGDLSLAVSREEIARK